jgi:hypothetical protein
MAVPQEKKRVRGHARTRLRELLGMNLRTVKAYLFKVIRHRPPIFARSRLPAQGDSEYGRPERITFFPLKYRPGAYPVINYYLKRISTTFGPISVQLGQAPLSMTGPEMSCVIVVFLSSKNLPGLFANIRS